MKSILTIIAILFIANFTQAQDTKAKQILDEVSAKTRTYTCISADFSFSTENKEMEDMDESNDGSIKIKGKKYNLKMKGLKGSQQESETILEVFSDGTLLWNYMKEGNQVMISEIDEEGNELMDPSSIFTIYERGFKSEFVAEKKVGSKTVYQINLFPDSDEYDFTKIEVSIDKATMMISAASLHALDGNLYSIVVNKMDTKNDFPDSDFVFNTAAYDDVEEIDLR